MKRFVTTSLLLMTLLLARSGHAAEIISQERSVTVHALALDVVAFCEANKQLTMCHP